MPLNRKNVENEAAAFKKDGRKRFEDALAALIALGFSRSDLGDNFLWESDPELREKALAVCREMSDGCLADAKERAKRLCDDSLDYYDFDVAWDLVENEARESFDMEGSHLLSLLEIWLALAFVNGFTEAYLKIMILRYIGEPYASPLWGNLPGGLLAWGKGYRKNIIDQISVIGQNAIIGSSKHAEFVDAVAKGATYYIRHRGSNFLCLECDALCEYPIPIDNEIGQTHANCMCWNEYFFEPL